jgi:hypothetical protein
VSPRKSRRKSACFSATVTSSPWRSSSTAIMSPAGPPPTIMQSVSMWMLMGTQSRCACQQVNHHFDSAPVADAAIASSRDELSDTRRIHAHC